MIVPRPREARSPIPVQLEKLLLAEGETDVNFLEALCKHLGIAAQVEIRSYDGKSKLRQYLRTIAATAEFQTVVKSLGVTRDCDENPAAALQSVNDAIAGAGIPASLKRNVALIPDSATPGAIEALFQRAVRGLPVFQCVDDFFNCVSGKGITIETDFRRDKRAIQVYLATQPEVQLSPGHAAYKGAWDFADAAFQPLRDFLTAL